jgi:hypothetical protein
MGVEFEEEHYLKDALVRPDFYIPSARLSIEINGRNHYYPLSTRYSNFFNFKSKLLKIHNYNFTHLNSWKLEGFINNDNRDGIKDLLGKTIKTYTEKV